ncbi:DUF6089 family protein [Flavisolibacter ginsenosidimutans]|uniref:Outer membrane beta-barrel protein n=1 Tax=Flavisolibacter ginsenosidimutans TaxID=661481 RepID=A0A5B8UF95_9BACT|nr:DUF6089 family protein [Flavisolibacter ginsenosidimutans]QEC55143.1 outer membrane beta-barrel protein [Flavisolibacter ginsenosidimutans]
MKSTLFLFLLFASTSAFSQCHLGVFAGGSNYIGDLNDKPFKRTKPAVGLSLNYDVSDRFTLRSGLTIAGLEGGDQYSGSTFLKQNRNLSFKSSITELSLIGELTVFNLNNINWSPYVFGGIAFFHFNPYVKDSGQKIFLRPLSTEGQGLSSWPVNTYSLNQLGIPFGGGVKFNLSEDIRLGVEVGMRRLFTDYLDDVSTSYPDAAELLAAKGPKAVELSYRGNQVPGETAGYPDVGFASKGAERGNPKTKDWYYFTGVHLTFRIGGGYGKTFASGRKRNYGCPSVPL